MLQGIEFGRLDERRQGVSARALRIEFALGALVRGEWRITDAQLEGPEFAAGLDAPAARLGRCRSPASTSKASSIERLKIEDGRAILADAASGSRLVLDKLEFKGDVRSLAGPVKGEGSFVVAGQHYPYRMAASRIADDGGVKVRLTRRSDRSAVDRRGRHLDLRRARRAALRGQPAIHAAGGPRARGRTVADHRAVARDQPHQGGRRGRSAGADRVPVRPGRPGDQAQRQRQPDIRPRARHDRHAVVAADRSRPRALALPDATRRRPLLAIRTLADSSPRRCGCPFRRR